MVQITADHIAGALGGDPQRTNNFGVEILALPSTEFWVSGVAFPVYQTKTEQIRQGNLFKKYVTGISYSDISLALYAVVDRDVQAEIESWWRRITPDSGQTIRAATNYKEEGTMFWMDGAAGNLKTWRLIGIFPSEVNFGQGNAQGGSAVEIQITLSVDQVRRE